eukprot:4977504-Pleurochrysis_carterae.AAC.4
MFCTDCSLNTALTITNTPCELRQVAGRRASVLEVDIAAVRWAIMMLSHHVSTHVTALDNTYDRQTGSAVIIE